MDKDNSLVLVTPDDLAFIEAEVRQTRRPFTLQELTQTLAFRKTAGQRTETVKIYDPTCIYQVGDSIINEYDEQLTVGSKVYETFRGSVILRVLRKTVDKTLNCEMMEVDYTGGGVFRKYVDYMAKTKTLVLLPANIGLTGTPPKIMGRESDPRITELPMTERDIKMLERALRSALIKSAAFFAWGDRWQLKADPPVVPDTTINGIETLITESRQSVATADLVRAFFGLEPSSDLFDITCLWLNHLLETKHRKEFVQVSTVDWGKWHLKSVLNSLPEGLALAAPESKPPEIDPAEKIDISPFHEFPLKVYLGWREIISGGVKIPKGFNKELAHSREYILSNAEEKQNIIAYFFPQLGYFLGLKDYFAAANVPQGTSMTLEKAGPARFKFWLKKSKKKISVAKVAYDAAADAFADAGEAPTMSLPNKIIYIERDQLAKLVALYPEREGKDLRELLIMVFKTFGIRSIGSALHYLRAYHLVDLLQRTTQEEVEMTLLNTPDFIKSDKKKGEFYFRPEPPVKEVVVPEAAPEAAEGAPAVILTPEEMALADSYAEHPEPIDEVAIADALEMEISPEEEARRAALAALNMDRRPGLSIDRGARLPTTPAGIPPKKEKDKKKIKIESDRRPKTRKSERRVLNESFAEQESEKDALHAMKDAEEDILAELGATIPGQDEEDIAVETPSEAAAEGEEVPAASGAKPAVGGFGSMLADKLKAALKKKREEPVPTSEDEEEKSGG